jgi:hypothetical protein
MTTTGTTPISVNPSPKTRFMQNGDHIVKHKQMVDSPEFQRGIDFAMLHCQSLWAAQITDGNTAMAVGLKMQGAMELAQNMKMLAESHRPQIARSNDNLNS